MRRVVVALSLLALATVCVAGEHKTSQLNIVVVKDANGKPVRNAAVVLHPVHHNGDQSRGGLELKTDAEGKATIDGIPYGKMRVQVIAPHLKTFGQDYEVDQPQMDITIKMLPP